MENFFTIDLGDVLLLAALIWAVAHFRKELSQTDDNALDDYEELSGRIKELDETALKGEMNKDGDLEVRTKSGIWLTSFQLDSKENKKTKQ